MTLLRYIFWWELRRLWFNLLLLGSALVLCFTFGFNLLTSEPGSGEYLLFITYLILLALANLFYTLIYCLYCKKAKEQRQRRILFNRVLVSVLILLVLYTIFILLIFSGLFS